MHSQTWTPLPPPSPQHLSGSSPCTSLKHAAPCVRHGLAIQFLHDSIHVRIPILPNHPTLSLSLWVQKSIIHICVFFPVLHTGSLFLMFLAKTGALNFWSHWLFLSTPPIDTHTHTHTHTHTETDKAKGKQRQKKRLNKKKYLRKQTSSTKNANELKIHKNRLSKLKVFLK